MAAKMLATLVRPSISRLSTQAELVEAPHLQKANKNAEVTTTSWLPLRQTCFTPDHENGEVLALLLRKGDVA